MSRVPQGSVLGPLLFLIYIYNLDDNITSSVLKFADNTKVFRKVNPDGDKQHLQNDLNKLVNGLKIFILGNVHAYIHRYELGYEL